MGILHHTWRSLTLIILAGVLCGTMAGSVLHAQEPEKSDAPEVPVALTIEPRKQIYTAREGLMVSFVFKALQPARVCFEKDPLSQFNFTVYRSGTGELPLQPVVTHDTRVIFDQRPDVYELASGGTHLYRLNLKRLQFRQGEAWTPGDYTVKASFNLCEQAEGKQWDPAGKEIPVKTVQPARFMIMN